MVAEKIGFDFARGRIDTSEHPFCSTAGPHDCRLTTRWDESYLPTALFGVLREAGHGLYEQGLRTDAFGLPAGEAASLGVHESQSRLWENLVARSLPFWEWCLPLVRRPKGFSRTSTGAVAGGESVGPLRTSPRPGNVAPVMTSTSLGEGHGMPSDRGFEPRTRWYTSQICGWSGGDRSGGQGGVCPHPARPVPPCGSPITSGWRGR